MNLSTLFDKILANRILTHFLYWVAIVLIAIAYGYAYGEAIELSIVLKKISLPSQILASYLFIYVLLPLLYKKRYWAFFLLFLASTYGFHIVMHMCNDLLFGRHMISSHPNHTFLEILSSGEYYLRYVVDIYMVVFVTAGIKLIKENLENKKAVETLEAEKAKKEYQYLQARMQPEFLLNTLDQIEKQSRNNNQIAASSIADLSEILDYSLYQSDKPSVSLMEECRQVELFAKLYVSGSKSISEIKISRSNISKTSNIKPMILLNIMDNILSYIDQIKTTNKTLTVDIISIEKNILIDLYANGISDDAIESQKLQSLIKRNVSESQIELSFYPTNDGCNIQIKTT